LKVEGGTSHPGFACHKQPVLELCLRDAIEQHSKSEIRPGSTVQSISDDRVYVHVTYTNAQAEQKTLRARFFVGADGKTGFTRKRYLEPKGITLETDKKYLKPPTYPLNDADYVAGSSTRQRGWL
jgi:2-polyprenyl-6-methoxyphenol hydroxylase-like FAD-dependent oxidoreductase